MKLILTAALLASLAFAAEEKLRNSTSNTVNAIEGAAIVPAQPAQPITVKMTDAEIATANAALLKVQAANKALERAKAALAVKDAEAAVDAANEQMWATVIALAKAANCENCNALMAPKWEWVKPQEGK